MTVRIVVIEDEEAVRGTVVDTLRSGGFDAEGIASGSEGLRAVREDPPDLVLLDLQLPGMDGIEVCRRLRADPATARVAIVMLTGLATEAQELLGFDVGADDYVTKPWRAHALLARLRAVLRRSRPRTGAKEVSCGPLELDPATWEARLDGAPLRLTPTEFHILLALVSNPGRPMTRAELIEPVVEARDREIDSRSVDVFMRALRKKFGAHRTLIETLHRVGYRLDPDARPLPSPRAGVDDSDESED